MSSFFQLQCDVSFFTISLRCGLSCSVLLQYKIFGCRNNELKWTRRIKKKKKSDNMCIKPHVYKTFNNTSLLSYIYIYIYIDLSTPEMEVI